MNDDIVKGSPLAQLRHTARRHEQYNLFYEFAELPELPAREWLGLPRGQQEKLCRAGAELFLQYARRMSPYAYFTAEAKAELNELCAELLLPYANGEEAEVLTALRAFLIRNNPFLLAENPPDEKFLRVTPYSHYSPALICRVLGLPEQSPGPLLDVGCGNGELVSYLREKGTEAYGLDINAKGEHLLQADWLTFPFPEKRFKTITAHQSFTGHFLHNHARRDGQYAAYAKQYMRILHALQPGGRFYYAPGLPFMESLLPPEEYRVESAPITGDACRVVVKRL